MANPVYLPFEQIYIHDPSIVTREIAGEMLLVPIRQNVADLQSIYLLNETALFAWQRFDGRQTLADIQNQLVQDFDVDEEQAGQDLLELVEQLQKIGAVVRV